MNTVVISADQAERMLELCQSIRSRPGMMIARFDWFTAEAFWCGYLFALHPEANDDFRTWGLAHLGVPRSNTGPIFELRQRHGLAGDSAAESSLTRALATEIAELVCDLVAAYVHARRA